MVPHVTVFVTDDKTIMGWLIGFPLAKGTVIGIAVVTVIHSGLSEFTQGLIIALVSATVGALGVVGAAIISARAANAVMQRQVQQIAHQQQLGEDMQDLRRIVGGRRKDDEDNVTKSPS